MDIFNVLSLIGGLALFLFGMKVMGDGLEKVAGGKFERILEKLTSNVFKGVAVGVLVTGIIQSSSATTVMVVGFVNSGIMKLRQAVGIIMGANIGTTVTAWLLSLTGLQSDNVFVSLLKPTSFSPMLAMIGIILLMASKKDTKKDIGMILLGFAVLMYGMDAMSGAVKPLAAVPEFAQILTLFSNPILGVLAGALLTAIIQSSSASVGILQALSATGAIPFGTAIPIILGQNIGTCATALISSIGSSKNGKRAALVHLYFNIIGTTLFLILFYVLNAIIHFSFVDGIADAAGIAIVHSVFNVFATLLLLPFTRQLEKLACMTIKDDKEPAPDNRFSILDERFLSTPSFAIEQCRSLTEKMADLTRETIMMSIAALDGCSINLSKQIRANEDLIDTYEDRIGTYLVKLSSRSLTIKDSGTVTMLQHCISDFERISDHSLNILENAEEMAKKKLEFSGKAKEELNVLTAAITEILNTVILAFDSNDISCAKTVEPLEEVVDNLRTQMKKRHMKRLRKGKCSPDTGFVLQDLLTNLERVSDHCSNIALCIIQIHDNSFETHEYVNELRRNDDSDFNEKYSVYKQKYILP